MGGKICIFQFVVNFRIKSRQHAIQERLQNSIIKLVVVFFLSDGCYNQLLGYAPTQRKHTLFSCHTKSDMVSELWRPLLYYSPGTETTNKSCRLTEGRVVCWRVVAQNSHVHSPVAPEFDNPWKTAGFSFGL